jgi:hypothetical protein
MLREQVARCHAYICDAHVTDLAMHLCNHCKVLHVPDNLLELHVQCNIELASCCSLCTLASCGSTAVLQCSQELGRRIHGLVEDSIQIRTEAQEGLLCLRAISHRCAHFT